MSFAKLFKKNIRKPAKKYIQKWRRSATKRVSKPFNPVRAHALGYRAKQGFVIVQGRMRKGGRHRPKPDKGRNPGNMGLVHFTPHMLRQRILEGRVAKHFPNLEVLNSYKIGEDGQYHYYEVILIDPNHPQIAKNKKYAFLQRSHGRAHRGLTSAGKKSRS
ncbi:MAG: 50S ribosomal protein L15e [Candidatus Aenigmatarchaeota archaeon]